LLVIQALTGVLLAYRGPVERALDPAGMVRQPGLSEMRPAQIFDSLSRAYPGYEVQRLLHPQDAAGTYFAHMIDRAGHVRYASVDPGSARVLRSGPLFRFPLELMLQVHFNLLGGRIGLVVTLIGGLALVLMVASGLTILWPRGAGWRRALAIRWSVSTRLLLRQLHRTIGAVASLVLVVLAATGVYLGADPLVRGAQLSTVRSSGGPIGSSAGIDQAMRAARSNFAGRQIQSLRRPTPSQLLVVFDEPAGGARAASYAEFSLPSGNFVKFVDHHALASLKTTIYPIHTGEIIGHVGRVLALVGGIVLLLMAGSGILMWMQARHQQKDDSTNQGQDAT